MTYFLLFFFLLIVAVVVVISTAAAHKKKTRKRRESLIENYCFPNGVGNKIQKVYPDLNQRDLDIVFQGLRDFFLLCHMAQNRMVSMPSKVVDTAWHEFILFTSDYRTFCHNAFGTFLDHTPAEGMTDQSSLNAGMKRAWHLACKREEIDPKSPEKLPLLFAIDLQLNIPDGMKYSLDDEENKKGTMTNPAAVAGCGGVPYLFTDSGCSGGDSSSSGEDSSSSGGDAGCGGGCGGD